MPVAITGSGLHVNNFNLIANGVIPEEGTVWIDSKNVWWLGLGTSITLDYGSQNLINDVLVSVDNNDRYAVDYSLDGFVFSNLFTILPSYGNVSASRGGMDTMSTDAASSEFVPGINFPPITARFLRFRATAGDGFYAVGELEAFGSPVPEPSTYGLIGAAALLGLAALRRTRRMKG